MEKYDLDAIELIRIASQHAYCAEHLLQNGAEIFIDNQLSIDALLPITSLIYTAFNLTFKAYLLHEHRSIKQHKTLLEQVELNTHLGLSKQEKELIHTLARTQVFHKGADYKLWENRQQFQVFCEQALDLYAHLQTLMPIEFQENFIQ